jgi:hypothetical protein
VSVKIGVVVPIRDIPEDMILPLMPDAISVYASGAGVELIAAPFVLSPTAARALAVLLNAAALRAEAEATATPVIDDP